MYPGQSHRIRRNLLNFVLAVDLGTPDGLAAAAAAQSLFQQQLPIRWGVLPLNTSLRIGERMKWFRPTTWSPHRAPCLNVMSSPCADPRIRVLLSCRKAAAIACEG